jgi:hypothetical protein
MLLPGYIVITLGVLLFFPTMILSVDKGISLDLFTIVVFIVGGPVVGFILLEFYYYISGFSVNPFHKYGWRKKLEFRRKYEELKLKCSEDERKELEELEGRHFFGVTTVIALTFIGLYGLGVFVSPILIGHPLCDSPLIEKESLFCSTGFEIRNTSIALPFIFLLAVILSFGAHYEYHRVHLPLICALIDKHSILWPEICEEVKKGMFNESIDETIRRYDGYPSKQKEALHRIKSEIDFEFILGRLSKKFYDQLDQKIRKKSESN